MAAENCSVGMPSSAICRSHLKPPWHQADIVGRFRNRLHDFNHHAYDVFGLLFREMLARFHCPISIDLQGQWPSLFAHYCQIVATFMSYLLVYPNPKPF